MGCSPEGLDPTQGRTERGITPIKVGTNEFAQEGRADQRPEAGDWPDALQPGSQLARPSSLVQDLGVWYGKSLALAGVTMDIRKNTVTAFIGPSGCGKSTLLRCFNRMNDLVESARIEGKIPFNGPRSMIWPPMSSRCAAGSAWSSSSPPPSPSRSTRTSSTVCASPAYERPPWTRQSSAPEKHRHLERGQGPAERIGPGAFRRAGPAHLHCTRNSRQSRDHPEDQPCSALDPISTLKIEELIEELKSKYTIVIVTHNMQQAARVSVYRLLKPSRGRGPRAPAR